MQKYEIIKLVSLTVSSAAYNVSDKRYNCVTKAHNIDNVHSNTEK